MEGSTMIHLLQYTERTFIEREGTHVFERWSDGQMTMGGPTKRSKFSQFVCNSDEVPAFRELKEQRSGGTCRVYIYEQLSGCTHDGTRIEMLSLGFSTEHSATQH